MKPAPGSYASVSQLRKREVPGTLMSATALLALVCGAERRYVMLQRDATAPLEPMKWQFPAGRCSPFENPIDTAQREMLEEVMLKSPVARLEDAQLVQLPTAPTHHLVAKGYAARFDAHSIEESNTLEFFVPVELAMSTFEGLELADNEPYGRQVQAFTLAEVQALAQAGEMTGAARAILQAALAVQAL